MNLGLRRNLSICLLVSAFFFCVSCANTKKVIYFDNIQDTTIASVTAALEPIIQKNDLLNISVSSLNPDASVIFNAPNLSFASSSGSVAHTSGYLVDLDGYIQFPVLGAIKVAGLTKKGLQDVISKRLVQQKLLIDPIVSVRYINFRITVLGEVMHPNVITVPSEKITILEAIGMAGDLSIYAKRDNILLIREENGQKIIKRLNLNSKSIFTSPYYYLKSNDIVYVEPNKTKVATSGRSQQVLPLVFGGLSVIGILVNIIVK